MSPGIPHRLMSQLTFHLYKAEVYPRLINVQIPLVAVRPDFVHFEILIVHTPIEALSMPYPSNLRDLTEQ
jgi:hypothetical protein